MKSKKYLILLPLLLCVFFGGFIFYNNKVKQEKYLKFNGTCKFLREYSVRLIPSIEFILDDYITNWTSAIKINKAMNITNSITDCCDFTQAVNWRISSYENKYKTIQHLDSCYSDIVKRITLLNEIVPEDKEDILKICNDFSDKIGEAIILVKNPAGSYIEYCTKKNNIILCLKTIDNKLSVYYKTKDETDNIIDEYTHSRYVLNTLFYYNKAGIFEQLEASSYMFKIISNLQILSEC